MIDGKVHWVKISYYEIISAIDDFFDLWDSSLTTRMEEICQPQG